MVRPTCLGSFTLASDANWTWSFPDIVIFHSSVVLLALDGELSLYESLPNFFQLPFQQNQKTIHVAVFTILNFRGYGRD